MYSDKEIDDNTLEAGRGDVVIDFESKVALAAQQEDKKWESQSIYRVPTCIKKQKWDAYSPHLVSLGPYHHGHAQLQPMETHKLRALHHFAIRAGTSVRGVLESLSGDLRALRDAYDSLDPVWENDDGRFSELMAGDGCFVLEMLSAESASDYPPNDPVFSVKGRLQLLPFIQSDMLMLENQLPMPLLLNLFRLKKTKDRNYPVPTDHDIALEVNIMILKFYDEYNEKEKEKVGKMGKRLHVLDLKRSLMTGQPESEEKNEDAKGTGLGVTIRSATELRESGVKFRLKRDGGINSINFNLKKGVLHLPNLSIDDSTESTFLNLVAFERCHVATGNAVTSYICLMDALIEKEEDVKLLQQKEIVNNAIGSDKAAADLFNGTITKQLLFMPESNLFVLMSDINQFCSKPWNSYRADLRHTYFSSPWAIISVVAAVFVIILTVVSTFYAVYPYYSPRG